MYVVWGGHKPLLILIKKINLVFHIPQKQIEAQEHKIEEHYKNNILIFIRI